MEFEDQRETSTWVPAVETLEQIIRVIPPGELKGIRKIVLLDRDYRKSREAAGARYVSVRGTKAADIEIYLERFSSTPGALRQNGVYWTWTLAWTLSHEIYHHLVRSQRRFRKPNFDREQRQAEHWAHRQAHRILDALFTREVQAQEFERIKKIQAEAVEANERGSVAPAGSPPERG